METYYAGKCIDGHFVKVAFADTYTERSNPKRLCAKCACGSSCYVKRLEVEINETKCGGRCQNAVNLECKCSCGGENHGIHKVAFGA